ncbi:hypothetical protein ACOSQ2_010008 [Xanthoceras sorbifolium]
MQLPSKVKIFLWRACHNALPTSTNLLDRKVHIFPLCCCCNKEMETIGHAIWNCELLQSIRDDSSFIGKLPNVILNSVLDFLIYCWTVLSSSDLLLLGIVLWKVWNLRNCILHHQPCIIAADLVPWCRAFLADFATAHVVLPAARVEKYLRWIPHIYGQLKLNTDAALNSSRCKTGLGAVLRNHMGEVLLSGMFSFDGVLKLDIAEAKALLFGVSMALDGGFSSFLIESDVTSIINYLISGILPSSEIDVVLENILLLLESFGAVFSFSHISRSANGVAHVLAKFSFDCISWQVWVKDCPSFLFNVFTEDVELSL